MRAIIALEARFERTPDGRIWSDGSIAHANWERYLAVFDELCVAARVRDVQKAAPRAQQADGPRVTFAALPWFVGPWQYALRRARVRRAVQRALRPGDAVILRAPGTIAVGFHRELRRRGQRFALEVVGDPHEVFAPGGGVRSLLRPMMRGWYTRNLRLQCAEACAVKYVTRSVLQERYPASPHAYVCACSDVELPAAAFATAPRSADAFGRTMTLLLIGSLAQLYKGPDVLIRALARCVRDGLDLRLRIIGDGRHRGELEELARRERICERVAFVGWLPAGDAVRAELDGCDLFVLPSRTEGLPRALIEAMARGLPCIGSHVGGIPELLEPEALVPPGDVHSLAERISQLARDPQRLARLSARNLETAREYDAASLRARERAFYGHVRAVIARE